MKIFLKILSAIGLLAWCVCFAFGFNYRQGGALTMSILMFVVVLAIFGLLLYLMSRWSNPKASDHRANARTRELVCLALYVVATVLTAGCVAQFITVQSSVKNEMQPVAMAQLDELQRVFDDENTQGSYLNHIKEQVVPTYANHLKGQYSDDNTVNMGIARLEDELTGDGEFEILQEEVTDYVSHARYSVQNWVPWTITRYLQGLDDNTAAWEEKVMKMSRNHEWTASEGFSISSVAGDSLLAAVTSPKDGNFGALAIILIIAMQLLMLLSYVSGRNWSVAGPRKATGNFGTWNGGAGATSQGGNNGSDNDQSSHRTM